MKKSIYIFFMVLTCGAFSQETLIKSFSSDANSIEISTEGLDELKIMNSENNQIEVSLFDENSNTHHILIDEKTSALKIEFKLEFIENEGVFKKFITKRLNRASAVIKLPKNKEVTIIGTNIGILSKNYNGDLAIYIDRGYVNLNEVQRNAVVKLFQGNIFATVSNSNINIQSTNGKIIVDEKLHPKNYKKVTESVVKAFSVSSINANVTITTQ